MKKAALMLSIAVSLMGLSSIAHADLESLLKSVNHQALSDIDNFNARLSRQFGIPVPNVEAIVNSVPHPEDAFMILHLSQMAHLEPTEALHRYQRNKGRGWGEMAQDMGIKPGSAEFHALKRGELRFAGERDEDAGERQGRGYEHGRGGREGRGENEHGNGNGRGHGRWED